MAVNGCTELSRPAPVSPSVSGGDPYAAAFREALEFAASDFEREVLADGKITDAEYEEAHQRWLSCITDRYPPGSGLTVALSADENGIYGYVVTPDPAVFPDQNLPESYERDNEECATGTIGLIAPLYNAIKVNPDNLDRNTRVVRCLKREGLVPDSYTEENLRADMDKVMRPNEPYDRSKVTDLDINDEAVAACLGNPDG